MTFTLLCVKAADHFIPIKGILTVHVVFEVELAVLIGREHELLWSVQGRAVTGQRLCAGTVFLV